MKFTLFHDDHGLDADTLLEIGAAVYAHVRNKGEGFFILQVDISGEVDCALWGPAMGDTAIRDDHPKVTFERRGDREWKDKLVDLPTRKVSTVQVIGSASYGETVLYTAYGGPLAPQNPDDPDNAEPTTARKFWAEHALCK